MELRQGWSGEVAPGRWAKFDITLQEEDLRRLLGSDYKELKALTPAVAYTILELEAERLVIAKLVNRYGMDRDEGAQSIATLEAQRNQVCAQVVEAGTGTQHFG